MTTPRDLLIIAMGRQADSPMERGDLSLALAAAELVDLLTARVLTLSGDRVVPAGGPVPDDAFLRDAAASAVAREPYETVADWLWRRGRDLAAAYLTALEKDGLLARQGHRWTIRPGALVPADSPARRAATARWSAHEPVLTALAAAAGLPDAPTADDAELADDETAVLAALGDAEMELEAVRQRKAIEEAAFDNVWRGGF